MTALALRRSTVPWGDLAALAATRVALSIAWRDDRAIAARLDGFASTEAGSALDMLAAAEREHDPHLRRLFVRHALDEARHAAMFRRAARAIHPEGARAISEHALIRATRQNLHQELGLVRFVAYVHLSERRAARQFELIARRFHDRPEIADLFAKVLADEKFDVAYSAHLLDRWRKESPARAREVRWALLREKVDGAWKAWRRAGRTMGDAVVRVSLVLLWAIALPMFALAERARPAPRGWQPGSTGARTLDAVRREG
jgi:hypothetical protein